jgi:hypothetical protein
MRHGRTSEMASENRNHKASHRLTDEKISNYVEKA